MILRRYHRPPDADESPEKAADEQPDNAPQAKPAGRSAAPSKAKKADKG
ncbi:hypothetical protein [Streptomyces sp. FIT100]|nr:hypothetical protein [Streptomyces sp. FIT100]UUN29431.1 hypothetical protein KK483_25925 [Streptomyces sp. FIT100]